MIICLNKFLTEEIALLIIVIKQQLAPFRMNCGKKSITKMIT